MTVMFATTPIRLFLVFAVLALLGFTAAAWTAGAPLAVLGGTIAAFAAALAVMVEAETDNRPTTTKPATNLHRFG
jgi:hypothetical protein